VALSVCFGQIKNLTLGQDKPFSFIDVIDLSFYIKKKHKITLKEIILLLYFLWIKAVFSKKKECN